MAVRLVALQGATEFLHFLLTIHDVGIQGCWHSVEVNGDGIKDNGNDLHTLGLPVPDEGASSAHLYGEPPRQSQHRFVV